MAKKLTSAKAKKILHDKSVHGHPLTKQQRKFFGAIAGGAEPYKAQLGIGGLPLTSLPSNWGDRLSDVLSFPQRAITKLFTGEYQTPSEAMKIQNPVGAAATDILLDPLNLVGAGLAGKAAKASTKTGILSNAYKLNPWAFKPNPEAYYRGVGKQGMEDILQSGIIRSKKQHAYPEPYFSKGMVGDRYAQGYFAELINEPMKGVGSFPKGSLIQTPVNQVSVSNPNLKLYQKDWLKGYKEIKPPKKKQDGGWLDKYEAQGGTILDGRAQQYLSGRTGDIQSVYPQIQKMKEEPKKAKTFADIEERNRQAQIRGKQTFVSAAPVRNVEEQRRHEEFRKKKLAQIAANDPMYDLDETGELVKSGYARFIDKYGKNLDKFASSLETPLAIESILSGAPAIGKGLKQLGKFLTNKAPVTNAYRLPEASAPFIRQSEYVPEQYFITGKGTSITYPEGIEKLKGLIKERPVLGQSGDVPIYFHGSTSANLPLVVKNKGLVPYGELVKTGDVPLTGELSWGITEGGVNQQSLSTVSFPEFGTAADYALRFSGKNKVDVEKKLADWFTKGGRQKYIEDLGESSYAPKAETFDDLLNRRLTTFQNLSDAEKEFVTENYPVMFGITPKTGGSGRFNIPRSDIYGEVGISGNVPLEEIPSIFVPKSRIKNVQSLLGDQPTKVLPIEDILTADQLKALKEKGYKNGGWLDKYEQGGMVLKQKTHDNYGKKPNANNSDVSLPPGFKGWAYNTKGRNYSPAWGGQFKDGGNIMPAMAGANQTVPMYQMGGVLPGAVGFTYARTQSPAPSNGPYAKKTKASAQNGKEMQYYQEGLDFKPKTISRNGGWLDKYEKAQVGKYIPPSTGDIASYYPAIKRMKEQPKMDQTKAEAKKREEQERSRKAIENQPTIGPAKPDYRTKKEKERNRAEIERRQAQANSPFAQTMSSFTPMGDNPQAGLIGAQSTGQQITAFPQSATNLTRFFTGRNPYGESNTDKVLGVASDVATVALGAYAAKPTGPVSIGPYTFGLDKYIKNQNIPVRQIYGDEALESFKQYGPTTQPGTSWNDQFMQFAKLRSDDVLHGGTGETMKLAGLDSYAFPYFSQGSKWYGSKSPMKEIGRERLMVPKQTADLTFYPAGERSVMMNFEDLSPETIKSFAGRRRALAPFANDFLNPGAFNVYEPKWYGYKKVFQDGGDIPIDPMGYWNPENIGNPVIIPSTDITMEGVDQPLIGISDTGDVQYMEPGEDYEFDGEYVTEYPVAQGGKTIYVSNPNDPRLRAYQDSLKLYKDYYDPSFAEKAKKNNYKTISYDEVTKKMKALGIRTPRESVKNKPYYIDPEGFFLSGNNPTQWHLYAQYKKPVQPVIYRPEPKIKIESSRPRFKSMEVEEKDLSYKLPEPKAPTAPKIKGPISEERTGYSYTYPTGSFGSGQKTIYFRDRPTWKAFVDQYDGGLNTEETKGKASATPGVYSQKRKPNPMFENIKYKNGGVSVNEADAQPIEKLDQLLNFTNYNKPTKKNWLDKYN